MRFSKFFSDQNLLRLISYGPILFIPMVVIAISLYTLHVSHIQYQKSLEDVALSYTNNQNSNIISKVELATELIEYEKSIASDLLQQKVKNRVDTAYEIAKNVYLQNKEIHSKKEVRRMIVDSLRPLVWNKGESFIFILDFDGVFHLAPEYLRHLEGKNIINFQDATKRYVIKEEINLAKSKGMGYLWDTFTRANYPKEQQFKQLAYIKRFDDSDWYMGSAEYLDTTQKETEESALTILKSLFINKSEYFFVIDQNGNNIMNGQNLYKRGENILSIQDSEGKYLVKELIESANSPVPYIVSYKIKNPVTKAIEKKYSYVKKVPNSNWIVGTGYYDVELKKQIAQKEQALRVTYNKELIKIFGFSFMCMLLALIVSYRISKELKERLHDYAKRFQDKNTELTELNLSLEQIVLKRTQELEKAYKEMKEIATKDSLTGIYNRYFFNEVLQNEIYRANRYNKHFALCMFDFDHFKKINDTYGHDIGDFVLKKGVEIVLENLRDGDTFARVGGEEFMIILPSIYMDAALLIAERIRCAIAEGTFTPVANVSVSVGLAMYKNDESAQTLYKRADDALYIAKENGRNNVTVND